MGTYPDWTAEERDGAAAAVAAILNSLGFTAMAADCRGERLQADLPRYASIAAKLTARYTPQYAKAVGSRLIKLGLVTA